MNANANATQLEPLPVCPWCQTSRHTQTGSRAHAFFCRSCKREFEDVDDGDIGYGNPEKYAVRKESFQQKNQGNGSNQRRSNKK